jgi:hypothetical protein
VRPPSRCGSGWRPSRAHRTVEVAHLIGVSGARHDRRRRGHTDARHRDQPVAARGALCGLRPPRLGSVLGHPSGYLPQHGRLAARQLLARRPVEFDDVPDPMPAGPRRRAARPRPFPRRRSSCTAVVTPVRTVDVDGRGRGGRCRTELWGGVQWVLLRDDTSSPGSPGRSCLRGGHGAPRAMITTAAAMRIATAASASKIWRVRRRRGMRVGRRGGGVGRIDQVA